MDKTRRAVSLFLKIGPFPAVIFFQIFAGPGRPSSELLALAAIMLAYCLLVLAVSRGRGGAGYFDYALTIYSVLIVCALLVNPTWAGSILGSYASTGLFLALFVAAFVPPLLGRPPFTLHYAKKTTPAANWNNPVFIRINQIMTQFWAGLMALALILSLFPYPITRFILPNLLFMVVGIPFNIMFPDYYLKSLGLPSQADQRRRASTPSTSVANWPVVPASTAWEAISGMPAAFNAQAAGELSAVIRFDVSGSETFQIYLIIKDGQCHLEHQATTPPDLTIHTPASVWLDISQGRLDGQEAFMSQAYRAEGDLGLLINLKHNFSAIPTQSESKEDHP